MSGGGKSATVGYRYYLGVQIACTHGPVDAVTEIIGGERSAWSGSVTNNDTISINQPDLFGGEKREGGWVGRVDVMMGGVDQPQNAYLAAHIDGPVPAYRGLVSLVFRGRSISSNSFMWSTGNPYFKAPWVRIRRIKMGWSRGGQVWYESRAQIGIDMNPAHIIYECLTNLEWGMGYSPADIDDASFRGVADVLYGENFGLSLLWMEQTTIEDFIKMILQHVDGAMRVNMKTGLFEIRLVRNNYQIDQLPKLTPDDIISMESFQRSAWGDTANEIVVKYTDRDQNPTTLAVQDIACIEAQGAVISVTREYVGIRDGQLASRCASRDLTNMTTPLAKVTLVTNRKTWDWDVTDVFALTWPRLGINGVPFRVIAMNKGTLIEGRITIEAIEDVFGLPAASYVTPQPSGWVDPVTLPKPVVNQRALEVPYWDIVRNTSPADMAYLEEGYAFGQLLAVKPTSDSFDFDLLASPNNVTYTYVNRGDFSPSALLIEAMPIGAGPVTFQVTGMVEIGAVTLGSYAYLENEMLIIDLINPDTGVISARRGTLDTVPSAHPAGSRIYFSDAGMTGYDTTQRTTGESVYYKALTTTGRGTLQASQAQPAQVTLTGRAHRPYPPGNVQINGQYFPDKVFGQLTVTWSSRNREQQTVDLVAFTAGNITPEPGQVSRIRVYRASDNSLLRTYNDLPAAGSWSYPAADDVTDGAVQVIRLELESVRDGLVSWQKHSITVDRHGFGFHFGEDFGGVAS